MELKINKLPFAFVNVPYEKTVNVINKVLILILVVAAISTISQGIDSIGYIIKIVLITLTSLIVCKETEILYLTHKEKIYRSQAKDLLKQSNPYTTALILSLILPIQTPIYIVAVASFVAILIGKMVFGGFSYNPFNPALIGKLFVTVSWPVAITSFDSGYVNYILNKIFDFSNSNVTTNIIGDVYSIILVIAFIGLVLTKHIKAITTVVVLLVIFTLSFIVLKDIGDSVSLMLTNSVLFASIFLINDPVTSPFSNFGKLSYSLIIAISASVILLIGKSETAIFYAILFAQLFVPMLNKSHIKTKIGINKQSVKLVAITAVFIGLILFLIINNGGSQ